MRIDVGEQDSGRTLEARVGDAIRIVLPENPTTGFVWTADPPFGGPLTLSRDENEVPGTVPGAGGRRILEVRADRPGPFSISLHHRRPWEGPESTIAVFRLSGTVR